MRAPLYSIVSRGWRLFLLTPALLLSCAHHHKPASDAKQLGMREGEYLKLTAKARGGDRDAAESLARLWYQHSEDNSKALYWLEVAAQNGSKRAAQVSQIAKSQLAE